MPGVTGRRLAGVLLGAAIATTAACSNSSKSGGNQGDKASGPTCDQDAARGMLAMMSDPKSARITEEDGQVIVRFTASWTASQREILAGHFVTADSCLNKKLRKIEFQAPTGETIAQADGSGAVKIVKL